MVKDVFPKSKLLQDQPPSQELSRLTYTAAGKPGRLPAIGDELYKRARQSAPKAGYNPRYRALVYKRSMCLTRKRLKRDCINRSFLLTLSVFKALCAECRRDLALFSKPLLKTVDLALNVNVTGEAGKRSDGKDLEILARAGSLMATFATFFDGQGDDGVSALYLRVLKAFSALLAIGSGPSQDAETKTRVRLVGLAAISAASTSEALFVSSSFQAQVDILVPALLSCFCYTDVASLTAQ